MLCAALWKAQRRCRQDGSRKLSNQEAKVVLSAKNFIGRCLLAVKLWRLKTLVKCAKSNCSRSTLPKCRSLDFRFLSNAQKSARLNTFASAPVLIVGERKDALFRLTIKSISRFWKAF